jgi:hypothetical protein
LIGKTGYEYLLGKESGVGTIKISSERLGLTATDEEMKDLLNIVK